jgi:hypothetical protein
MTLSNSTKLNLSLSATLETTELFGVPISKISECMLIDAATTLKGYIAKLTDLNKDLESVKVIADIAKLVDGMRAVSVILDGDQELAPIAQGMSFDLEKTPLVERLQVFGVYTEQLTEQNLTEALIELKKRVNADKEVNKGLDSKRIKTRIASNNKSIKLLVNKLDLLETKA